MADLEIDLTAEITKLKTRRGELDTQEVNPPGPTANEKTAQRLEIVRWKTKINEKIAALNTIKTNQAAAVVTVKNLTPQEINDAQNAMTALNTAVQQAQTWTQLVTTATALLNSADTVVQTAQRA